MAIVKHVRSGNDDPSFFSELKTALEGYFDDVTINEDTTPKYMECSVTKDGELVKIFELPTVISGSYIYKASYPDGSGQSVIASAIGNNNPVVWEFYECPNGIMIAEKRYNAPSEPPLRPFIGVTRDNNGNTVVIAPRAGNSTGNLYSNNTLQFFAINKNSRYIANAFGLPSVMFTTNSSVSFYASYSTAPSMSRIPVNDENAYCPNAYIFTATTPEIANPDVRKIVLDGVTYVTNGAWCLKDE